MAPRSAAPSDAAEIALRARAWHHAQQAVVCDVLERWAHGTIVRATRFPHYFDYNLVRVEEDPAMSVGELAIVADEALAGLAHRRIDFELIDAARTRRAAFEAAGWRAMALSWMRLSAPPSAVAPAAAPRVEEVPYDSVHELRVAWHEEDLPELDTTYLAHQREIARLSDVTVMAVIERGAAVGFAQLLRAGDGAEITQVYVGAEQRGAGRGGALVAAAVRAAGDVRDVWICADDEDRPKRLYARLGFRPAWTSMEFQRVLAGG
jgi:GNAT superfamily N-acetyltransferase